MASLLTILSAKHMTRERLTPGGSVVEKGGVADGSGELMAVSVALFIFKNTYSRVDRAHDVHTNLPHLRTK